MESWLNTALYPGALDSVAGLSLLPLGGSAAFPHFACRAAAFGSLLEGSSLRGIYLGSVCL